MKVRTSRAPKTVPAQEFGGKRNVAPGRGFRTARCDEKGPGPEGPEPFDLVEAAGVEPASEKQSPTGATCFADLYRLRSA
jgi:hypothetical protein